MKKSRIIATLLILVLSVFVISACGRNNNNEADTPGTPPPADTTETTPPTTPETSAPQPGDPPPAADPPATTDTTPEAPPEAEPVALDPNRNLALNRPITTPNNMNSADGVENIVDGNPATRGRTNIDTDPSMEFTFILDLGEVLDVASIYISRFVLENGQGERVEALAVADSAFFEYSINQTDWTELVRVPSFDDNQTLTFDAVEARYIRFTIEKAQLGRIGMYSMEIFGPREVVNLALNRPVTSPNVINSVENLANIVDGNPETRGRSNNETDPAMTFEFTVDLGEAHSISRIYISRMLLESVPETGDAVRNEAIAVPGTALFYYSLDGNTWSELVRLENFDDNMELTFDETEARYVRFFVEKATLGRFGMYSLEIFEV